MTVGDSDNTLTRATTGSGCGVGSLSDDDDDDNNNNYQDETDIDYTTNEPNVNDVLCGRGGSINSHPGNERFRMLVEKRKRVYLTARFKREKRLIAGSIVSEIRSLQPRGRFLTKDTKTGLWRDIGYEKSRDKTSQALRENAPSIRAEIETEICEKRASNTTSISHQTTSRSLKQPIIPIPNTTQSMHTAQQQQQQQQQQAPTMIPILNPYYAATANGVGPWMYPFYGYMHPGMSTPAGVPAPTSAAPGSQMGQPPLGAVPAMYPPVMPPPGHYDPYYPHPQYAYSAAAGVDPNLHQQQQQQVQQQQQQQQQSKKANGKHQKTQNPDKVASSSLGPISASASGSVNTKSSLPAATSPTAAAAAAAASNWTQSAIEQTTEFVSSGAESIKNWTMRSLSFGAGADPNAGNTNSSRRTTQQRHYSSSGISTAPSHEGSTSKKSVMTYKHCDDTKKRRMVKFRDDDTNSNFSNHRVRGRRVRPCYPSGTGDDNDELDDQQQQLMGAYDDDGGVDPTPNDDDDDDLYEPLNDTQDYIDHANGNDNNNVVPHHVTDNYTFITQMAQLFAPSTATGADGSWDLSHIVCGHDTTDQVPFPSSSGRNSTKNMYNSRDDYYDEYEDNNDDEIEWEGQEVQLVEEKKNTSTGGRHYADDPRYPPERPSAGGSNRNSDNASASLAFSSIGSCHSWIPEHVGRGGGTGGSLYDDDEAEEIITSGGSTSISGGAGAGNKSCSSHDFSSGERSIGGSSLTRVFDTTHHHHSSPQHQFNSPINMNHKALSRIPSWERSLRSKSPLSLPSDDEHDHDHDGDDDDDEAGQNLNNNYSNRSRSGGGVGVKSTGSSDGGRVRTNHNHINNNDRYTTAVVDNNIDMLEPEPLSPTAFNHQPSDYFPIINSPISEGLLRLNSMPTTDDGGPDMVF